MRIWALLERLRRDWTAVSANVYMLVRKYDEKAFRLMWSEVHRTRVR